MTPASGTPASSQHRTPRRSAAPAAQSLAFPSPGGVRALAALGIQVYRAHPLPQGEQAARRERPHPDGQNVRHAETGHPDRGEADEHPLGALDEANVTFEAEAL